MPAPPLPSSAWADHEPLDMARAVFLQSKIVTLGARGGGTAPSGGCTVAVEQRTYAHRTRLQVLVTDFILTADQDCASTVAVRVAAGPGANPMTPGMQDFNWSEAAAGQHRRSHDNHGNHGNHGGGAIVFVAGR